MQQETVHQAVSAHDKPLHSVAVTPDYRLVEDEAMASHALNFLMLESAV